MYSMGCCVTAVCQSFSSLPGDMSHHRLLEHPVSLLQIVFVTTEVAPWSKVGGLGDVMAALPAALAAR